MDFLWLPTHVGDPLERLRAASAAARAMKQHLEAVRGGDLGALLDAAPPVAARLLEMFIRHRRGTFGLFGNVGLSNVQGPREPLRLGNLRYDNWFSTGHIVHGTPLNMTVWSYGENMNLCIMADSAIVKDGWALFGSFRDALNELLALGPGHTAAVGART
jgi:hypothetical protein